MKHLGSEKLFILLSITISYTFSQYNRVDHLQSTLGSSNVTNYSLPVLSNIEQDPVESILNRHSFYHNLDSINNDLNICNRNFVIGSYTCKIAKTITFFLDDLFFSIISNQTFLWNNCDDIGCLKTLKECALLINPLIPSLKDAMDKLKSQGCQDRAQKLLEHSHKNKYSGLNFSHPKIDSLQFTNNQSLRTKYNICIYGEEACYGALFNYAFIFNNTVADLTKKILDSSAIISGLGRNRAFVIGVHARHSNEIDLESGFIKYRHEKDCIKNILIETRSIFGERFCIILLSTDRNHTLTGLSTFAQQLGCELVNAKDTKKHFRIPNDDGIVFFSDLMLLGNSDYFIGSTVLNGTVHNSFSTLVANLVALNHRGTQNIIWLPNIKCKSNLQPYLLNQSPLIDESTHSNSSMHMNCPTFIKELNKKAVKAGRSKEIFFIENCTRHSIPNWDTFLSMKIPVNEIIYLTDKVLDSIILGESLKTI